MPYEFQVVVDASDPHELADWWAETLDWAVEPQDEGFIRRMIDDGLATDEDTTRHHDQLVWKTAAAVRSSLDPQDEHSRRILFQRVPEAKSVKNRLHLDVRVGAADREMVVERLIGRGATFLHTGHEGPQQWVTLADPEGNEFCVV
jgi:hypothetical protein